MQSSYMLPPNKTVSGFGVTSVVLGSVALVICWVPLLGCLSLPLGIIGLIFGIVGLIIANRRKKHGFVMPIAGSVVSLVAVVCLILFSWFYGCGGRWLTTQMPNHPANQLATVPATQAAQTQATSSP